MQEKEINLNNYKFTYKYFDYGYNFHEKTHDKSYIYITLIEYLRFKSVTKLNVYFKKIFGTNDDIYEAITANIIMGKNNLDPVLCHLTEEIIVKFTSVKKVEEDKLILFNKRVDKYIKSIKKYYNKIDLNNINDTFDIVKAKSGDCYCLCIKNNPLKTGIIIIKKIYKKIKQRYEGNVTNFLALIWASLFRYKYLKMHYLCALEENLFHDLNKKLNINVDLFSSITNCNLNYFCSPFYDLEKYFGSIGTYYNFTPIFGNYLLIVTYNLFYILKMFEYINDILSKTTDVMFFTVLPVWSHDDIIKANTYCKTKKLVPISTIYDEKLTSLKKNFSIHDRIYCEKDFNFYCYDKADPVLNILQNNVLVLSNNKKKSYDFSFLPNNYLSLYEAN